MHDATKIGESNMENKMTDITKILETEEGRTFTIQALSIIAPVAIAAIKNDRLIALGMICFTLCYIHKNNQQQNVPIYR